MGALVTGADIYSRFLYLSYFVGSWLLGMDALGGKGSACIEERAYTARECGRFL